MFSPLTVSAASTVKATSSGSTSGNETNTIKTSNCTGSSKLSGIDAQVFSKIKPNHAGTVVCAKSDGFKTVATGTSNVSNYHWTAWYKNSLNADVDRTQGTGNYHGFNKSKVEEWKQYEENIRKLNGGRFPESRNYVYPTDTKNGKLSFWGDIAGYYGVLGDPQYAQIHLEAYQQFSYRVENVTMSYSYWIDPNYVPPKPPKPSKPSDNDNDTTSKPKPPNSVNPGDSNRDPCKGKNPPKHCNPKPPTGTGGYCQQFLCPNGQQSPDFGVPGQKPQPPKPSNTPSTSNPNSSWPGGPSFDTRSSSSTIYLGSGQYKTTTTTVDTYNETKQVKVADATVGAKAYATEIAAYSRIALKPGTKGTLVYNVNHNKFWKTKPSYWTDNGKETIKNKSYPYHFASESQEGKGKNNVNLYAVISKKDKLYTVIHGYPDIKEAGNSVPDPDGHPNKPDKTCVEVLGKETCSKDETPLIDVEIDINKDEPQAQVQIDRFVHLTKDKK